MGNEVSLQRKYEVQSHPYCVSDHYEAYSCYDANLRPLTLFVFTRNATNFDINLWKSVRHPFILKYCDSGTFRGKKCIVSEPVTPLSHIVEDLSVEQIISGISNIAEALNFIHETCKISHNFLSMETIFVSSTSHCFKLGSLHLASQLGSEYEAFLKELQNQKKLSRHVLSPECSDQIKPFASIRQIHTRDSFDFGKVLEQLSKRGEVVNVDRIASFCSPEPDKRPKPITILEDDAFAGCGYRKVINMVTTFASLDEAEKRKCLQSLPDSLRLVPDVLVASKLIPFLLTSRVLMMHQNADDLLPFLFTPKIEGSDKGIISESLFRQHVVPVICKLFCVHKTQFRLILLRHLQSFASHIGLKSLKEYILPQIFLGLRDENDELVSATFNALSFLVETYGSREILGERKKLFHSVVPKDNVPVIEAMSIRRNIEAPTLVVARSEPDGAENMEESVSTVPDATEQLLIESQNVPESETIIANISGPAIRRSTSIEYPKRTKTKYSIDMDIKSLDIEPGKDEIELMFGSMEPKFKKSAPPVNTKEMTAKKKSNKFDVLCDDSVDESGWNEESWD